MGLLKELSAWLYQNNLLKEAQKIDELAEYAEPWHEEAVKEFGDEIEEPLEPFKSRPNELLQYKKQPRTSQLYADILEQENFTPLKLEGREESQIGAGAFGMVFDGVYDGQPAVAKIILVPGSQEALVWNKIMKIKETMPPNLQKHIPIIYKASSGKVHLDDDDDDIMTYDIIVMEKLYPLESHNMSRLLVGWSKEIQPRLNNLKKQEDYLYIVSQKVIDSFFRSLRKNFINIEPEDFIQPHQVMKILLDNQNTQSVPSRDFYDNLSRKIYELFSKWMEQHRPEDLKIINEDAYNRRSFIYTPMSVLRDNLDKPEPFPNDEFQFDEDDGLSNSFHSFWEQSPETKELLEALMFLRENGIKWRDTHIGNLMLDRDGNIKIIDVGLYKHD